MKLFVAGSINQDILIEIGRQPNVGETLTAENVSYASGGKGANQAVAAARAGAEVIFLGAVGDDEFGKSLIFNLQNQNISTDSISTILGATTGMAVISIMEGDNSIILHSGANAKFSPANIEREMNLKENGEGNSGNRQGNKMDENDFILAQLETPQATTRSLFELGKKSGATCILNPAPATPLDEKLIQATDYLIVNEIELNMIYEMTQKTQKNQKEPKALNVDPNIGRLLAIKAQYNLDGVICTLGKAGVIGCHKDEVHEIDAISVEKIIDTTGAGDCFVGFFTAMLMQGENFYEAIYYANLAASISIQSLGAQTSIPTKKEVFELSNK